MSDQLAVGVGIKLSIKLNATLDLPTLGNPICRIVDRQRR